MRLEGIGAAEVGGDHHVIGGVVVMVGVDVMVTGSSRRRDTTVL
jgi:hypothetical protein